MHVPKGFVKEVKEDKQVFGESSIPTDAKEVFAGDASFYQMIESDSGGEAEDFFALAAAPKPVASKVLSVPVAGSGASGKKLGILKLSLIIVLVIVGVMLLVPVSLYCFSALTAPEVPSQSEKVGGDRGVSGQSEGVKTVPAAGSQVTVTSGAGAMEEPASWKMAQVFYQQKDYAKASSAYGKLLGNLGTDSSHAIIRDFLYLRLALCSQRLGDGPVAEAYFNKVLRSQAPSVVALANYHMAYSQFAAQNYSEARTKAYQTLAIVETIERPYCETMINDCYYLIAQSLTAQAMMYESERCEVPVEWPTVKYSEPFEQLDEAGLLKLLQAGSSPLKSAVLGPQVQKLSTPDKLQRWFVKAYRAPIEEVYVNFAASGGPEVHWACEYGPVHSRAITLYLPAVTGQRFAEIATGAAGLLASFESKKTLVYNPDTYSSVMERKALLGNEAMAAWQRFIFSYPKDKRLADAHFGLGVLGTAAGQYVSAVGEYRQVANNFSQSALAPYALFNSGKLQLGLKDYESAKADLKELTVQYADSQVSDHGNIMLAQTAMALGDYENAQFVFRKIYNLELPAEQKLAAAMGAAKCYYAMGDNESAAVWFQKFLDYAKASKIAHPAELQNAYLMLAQSYANMGKYGEACSGYKSALANSASPGEQFEITMELGRAFMKQQSFVEALQTIETINIIDLTAEQTCRLWTAKARVLRAMNLPDQGLTILEGKAGATSSLQIKSEMMLEMAQCYNATGNYARARGLLCEAIVNMPQSSETAGLQCDLAEVCLKMNENQQAINVCNELLKGNINSKIKARVEAVLGEAYTKLKQFDRAAMVYGGAGIIERPTSNAQRPMSN